MNDDFERNILLSSGRHLSKEGEWRGCAKGTMRRAEGTDLLRTTYNVSRNGNVLQ